MEAEITHPSLLTPIRLWPLTSRISSPKNCKESLLDNFRPIEDDYLLETKKTEELFSTIKTYTYLPAECLQQQLLTQERAMRQICQGQGDRPKFAREMNCI